MPLLKGRCDRFGKARIGRIDEQRNRGRRGYHLVQAFQPLRSQLDVLDYNSRQVGTWLIQTGDKPNGNRGAAGLEDDRNRCGR